MNERPTFDLLTEPWIRVMTVDDEVREVGLLELFQSAERIARLSGDLPTQDVAILRLCLAIMHRAVEGPTDIDHWYEIFTDPQATLETVSLYLEDHRERFDLRDPVKPFFQVADLRTKSGEFKGIEAVLQDVPASEKFFTLRRGKGLETMSWAEAARWLVACHAYDISGIHSGAVGDPRVKGGRGYGIGTGWAGQLGIVYVVGSTLWETLLYNLVARDHDGSGLTDWDLARDLPPWEREPDDQTTADVDGISPTGPVNTYTWQSRRIRLHGAESVTGVLVCQGDRITPQNRQTVEPMTAWRYSKPQSDKHKADVYMPQKFSAQQVMWRGLRALLPQIAGETPRRSGGSGAAMLPAGTLSWFSQLAQEFEELSAHQLIYPVSILTMEYGSNEAVFDDLVVDEIALPLSALTGDPQLILAIKVALDATTETAYLVGRFAANIAQAAGAEPDKAGAIRDESRREFLYELEPEFREWLAQDSADRVTRTISWQRHLRARATAAGETIFARAPLAALRGKSSGDAGRANAWFHAALKKTLPDAYPKNEDSEVGHDSK